MKYPTIEECERVDGLVLTMTRTESSKMELIEEILCNSGDKSPISLEGANNSDDCLNWTNCLSLQIDDDMLDDWFVIGFLVLLVRRSIEFDREQKGRTGTIRSDRSYHFDDSIQN